jgi:hypothetical protein
VISRIDSFHALAVAWVVSMMLLVVAVDASAKPKKYGPTGQDFINACSTDIMTDKCRCCDDYASLCKSAPGPSKSCDDAGAQCRAHFGCGSSSGSSSTPADEPATSIQSTVEPFTDRPALDYRYFSTNDSRVCENTCVAESRCAAWTYVEPGVQGTSGFCWLKHDVPGPRQHDACTSGVKISNEPNIDRPGSDYKRFTISASHPNGPEFCQAVCVGEAPRCQAWTYVKPGVQESSAVCYLKDQVPAAQANDCCTSGFVGDGS